ncbi:hypothetical protein [Leuconostoc falkenbergense]|uniref:hypothetical protein n=1 Tax=Leuconostoc falkenbergense TaxID=2766470 RepID=UPI001662D660|nr:hypothetical protein [Leuconostoc falkenbergense]
MNSLTYFLVMSLVVLTFFVGILGTAILLMSGPLYDDADIERDIKRNKELIQ